MDDFSIHNPVAKNTAQHAQTKTTAAKIAGREPE